MIHHRIAVPPPPAAAGVALSARSTMMLASRCPTTREAAQHGEFKEAPGSAIAGGEPHRRRSAAQSLAPKIQLPKVVASAPMAPELSVIRGVAATRFTVEPR